MSFPASRPRVVFDCNTIIQAVAFQNGPAAMCLRLVELGRIQLFFSKATLVEWRRTLESPAIRDISSNMTPERIGAFLQRLTYRATRIRSVPRKMRYPRDPNDEPYINLCIAARADYLVSRDNDLLELMSENSAVGREFRQRTSPLRVVRPNHFLQIVGHP
ncbi:MAG TPA: putative toxin-antitoxin system toxin component, PIN family [Phycisphaerae bacterium]|nr:putative toxin-antitoxin system toxin component, PIN family [Phycisphaerae bacterium]